ncbi:hypothetical protein EV132_1675 [Rhizobium sullae]|uniref:Uncharacterized protein n=1 Tax=Rhizobium sullae TaxID=50338 RepID=A0A4R3PPU5_RHISU|nr:hypothetical protein EV132_1675 [Rhizobium sullae]
MGSAILLRSDLDGDGLRLLARHTKDASQARRFMMVALVLMLLGSAESRCRSCVTGWCGSTPVVPTV